MDMKRFFLYAIVIAALTLAGCGGNGGGGGMTGGGNGGGTTTPPPPPPGPTPEEMALKDAQDAAMAAYMMAMGYVNSAKDYVAMGNAQKYADMAKGASDMAAAATTSAMAEEYQMKAEMYRNQAMEAANMRGLGITKLANMIVNQQQIENAELEGRPAVTARNNATRVAPALKVAAENDPTIATNGSVANGLVLQESASTPTTVGASVTLDDRGRFTYTVTVEASQSLAGGEMPQALKTRGDWPGVQLVRTETPVQGNEPGMTYVNIYTDIQAPTHDYASVAEDNPAVRPRAADGSTAGSVIVAGAVPADGSNFAATVNIDSADNKPPVMGEFQCAATAQCSISVNADGEIVAIQNYTFHKGLGTTRPDSDYLAWGVWLTVPGAVSATGVFPSGATTVGTAAGGNDVFSVNAALKGKATYNGVATGLYSAGGMVENFDADIMLEANFGSIVGADSDPNTDGNNQLLLGAVTGMVSNINAGGMAVDGSLALLRAPVVTTAEGTASTSGFTGSTDGIFGGVTYRGAWGGQFYGPNNASGDAIQDEFPTTAAGTFGAAAENGASFLGAFGSWKQ